MIFIATVALLATGCTKAVIDETPTNPVNRTVTYNADVAPIINNWCTTCHGGAAPSAGIGLSTFSEVKFQTESGNLVARINNASNPMPPAGQLSSADIQLIEKWVSDGFPEQ